MFKHQIISSDSFQSVKDIDFEYGLFNVGTGGTRYYVSTQKLRTAGFVLYLKDKVIVVDPGPGALVYLHKYGFDFSKVTHIFVSHFHLDHYGDAEAIIEAVSYYKGDKSFDVIVNTSLGGKHTKGVPKISDYYREKAKKVYVVDKDQKKTIAGVDFLFTPTVHHEPDNIGFILKYHGLKIGYVSDSEYFEGFESYFSKVDVLISHPVLLKKPKDLLSGRHASFEDVVLMANAQPKLMVFRHLGYDVINYGVEMFVKDFVDATGIPALGLKDGDFLLLEK